MADRITFTSKSEGTEITYSFDGHLTYTDFIQHFIFFSKAIGYHEKTIEEHLRGE